MIRKPWWTPLAIKDLLEIREYIQREHSKAARQEALKIQKSVERLSRFPESGRIVETVPGVREVVSGSYRVFYRIAPARIIILRVYHGRRSVPWIP